MTAKSLFGKWFAGSPVDPPVLSDDSPDGTGATARSNRHGLFATLLVVFPVGGSPTGAGGSPAPPIFKTASKMAMLAIDDMAFTSPFLWVRGLSSCSDGEASFGQNT